LASKSHREFLIKSAVDEGKFPESRAEYYRNLYNRAPKRTTALIESLAPGLPPGSKAALGVEDEGLPAEWFATGHQPATESPAPPAASAASPTKAEEVEGLPWFSKRPKPAQQGRVTFAGDET
jgi:hypothetical protein